MLGAVVWIGHNEMGEVDWGENLRSKKKIIMSLAWVDGEKNVYIWENK